ncbi:hypothetical protein JCM11251_001353 [Rhodosporidiobolus azoricus]
MPSPSPSRPNQASPHLASNDGPMYIPRSGTTGSAPLVHAAVAPSTASSSTTSDSSVSSLSSLTDPGSPLTATGGRAATVAPFGTPRGGPVFNNSGIHVGLSSGLDPKLSPTLSKNQPFFGIASAGEGGATSGMMLRSNSSGLAARNSPQLQQTAAFPSSGTGHLRRRSSTSNIQTSLLLGEAASPPASTGMERAASLTTFMKTGGKGKERVKRGEKHGGPPPLPRVHRRRLYTSLVRLLGLVTLTLLSLYLLKKAVSLFFSPLAASPEVTLHPGSRWAAGLKSGNVVFDTLETVPYPTSTHPRTPPKDQQDTLSLAEYLTTRLGSHFSFPSANIVGRASRGSQLWLTTATKRSVVTSTRHLVAFVNTLETTPLAQFQADFFHSTNFTHGVSEAHIENRDQRNAQRILVTLCRDEGCMDFCRKDKDLYCFGGFVGGRKGQGPKGEEREGLDGDIGDEVAKVRAMVETLESGRRVFWVDDGVYFKRDPVPHMGDLSSYDLQIPDTWSTGYINTGYLFVNPTQRTISLFRKLLEISLLLSDEERLSWASTNLLLDPSGTQRSRTNVAPKHSDNELDENIFDDEDEAPAGGKNEYGQVEFESPWDGGVDVKVLDPKRFRTSEGRLGRKTFDFEKKEGVEKLYWHCVCCGDVYTNDYIAGALGFHQPLVSYSLPQLTSVPALPLILKTPALRGSPSQIRYAVGLLLEIAHSSGRTFIPPLTVTLLEENGGRVREAERYIWRVVPVARWANPTAPSTSTVALGDLPRDLKVHEPGFVQHAVEHLREMFPNRPEATRLINELTETLFLDVRELVSLKDMIYGLTRPFWSTERIVSVEGVVEIMGKSGWELKSEFVDVAMCKRGEEKAAKGTCSQMCPL